MLQLYEMYSQARCTNTPHSYALHKARMLTCQGGYLQSRNRTKMCMLAACTLHAKCNAYAGDYWLAPFSWLMNGVETGCLIAPMQADISSGTLGIDPYILSTCRLSECEQYKRELVETRERNRVLDAELRQVSY